MNQVLSSYITAPQTSRSSCIYQKHLVHECTLPTVCKGCILLLSRRHLFKRVSLSISRRLRSPIEAIPVPTGEPKWSQPNSRVTCREIPEILGAPKHWVPKPRAPKLTESRIRGSRSKAIQSDPKQSKHLPLILFFSHRTPKSNSGLGVLSSSP